MLPVARVRGRESRRLPLELPAELLCKVVGAAGRTLVCRQLSKELSLVAASQAVSLRFIPSFAQADGEVIPLPSTVVRAVVTWCRALEELSLADAACADDALVSWLLKAAPSLCRLDVSSRKSALTTQSLQLLRAAGPLEWAAAGCWRMHAPNPSLTPYEVLSIQVWALRYDDGTDDGIASCFRFASPANRSSTGPVGRFGRMIRSFYGCMLRSPTSTIAYDPRPPSITAVGQDDVTTFVVSFELTGVKACSPKHECESWLEAIGMESSDPGTNPTPIRCFTWGLIRQRGGEYDGCWMTEAVSPCHRLRFQQALEQPGISATVI